MKFVIKDTYEEATNGIPSGSSVLAHCRKFEVLYQKLSFMRNLCRRQVGKRQLR